MSACKCDGQRLCAYCARLRVKTPARTCAQLSGTKTDEYAKDVESHALHMPFGGEIVKCRSYDLKTHLPEPTTAVVAWSAGWPPPVLRATCAPCPTISLSDALESSPARADAGFAATRQNDGGDGAVTSSTITDSRTLAAVPLSELKCERVDGEG
jgi:hypothetical protein